MKTALFLIALATGGAAIAQTETPPAAPPPTQMSAPGNSAPQRDARGVTVISAPADVPAGWNEAPRPGGTGAAANERPAPTPATENYPICSRTVTDNCVQAYERGRAPR
jgi:hypothetical protein